MRPGEHPDAVDEFDEVDASGGPRGAHRAPRSWWSRWWPFVTVLVVFPVLAYGLVTWLSDWDGLSGVELPSFSQSEDDTQEPSAGATATETATAAPVETPAVTQEPTPEPVADLTRPVSVLNATSRAGLAGGASDRLEAAGFTAATADNWDGDDLETSVVYYPAAADVATAQAVAAALGIATVQEDAAQAPDGLVVVLAADYEP
ncbi:LytR C-terminal domain-containing protein [Cellulomonas sp. KRMCY2]|uniref:LytR C-terminal domain-containing protein n=1 Tax=Cellulomonas sp. KRMCY2 TaxID=1304865 RepID=UPI00045EB45C|nr:LytR C-terminal domain-containing protein [Cellulomonas sp. KRMCY2]